RALDRVALVDDDAQARHVVRRHPEVTAVTREGDVYAPGLVRGGSHGAPSLIELQAALEAAQAEVARATTEAEQARFAAATAEATRGDLSERVDGLLERLHESDARMSAIAE